MNRLFFFLVLFLSCYTGCREKVPPIIRFCSDISPEYPCIGEDSVFISGSYVWVQLLLNPGYKDTLVTGNLYGYQEGERIFIGSKDHILSTDQTIVMEALFLNLSGYYEVDFLDSRGRLLASGKFEIW